MSKGMVYIVAAGESQRVVVSTAWGCGCWPVFTGIGAALCGEDGPLAGKDKALIESRVLACASGVILGPGVSDESTRTMLAARSEDIPVLQLMSGDPPEKWQQQVLEFVEGLGGKG